MRKKLAYFSLAFLLVILSTVISDILKPFLQENYGISWFELVTVFLCAELLFVLGIMIILWSYKKKATLNNVGLFELEDYRISFSRNRGAFVGLVVNRVSWILPCVYFLYVGWSKFPWFVNLGLCLEILLTVWLGLIVVDLSKRK